MVKFADAWEKAGLSENPEADRENEQKPEHEPTNAEINNEQTNSGAAPRVSQQSAWDERLFQAVNDEPFLPEIFKLLRSRIIHPINKRPVPRTIMITSAAPKEGKSFVIANLGISLAQGLDQYCLLVDCDLRRPSLTKMLGLDNSRGLVDYLRDHESLDTLISKTSVNKLSVLPSGKPPVNPAELLSSTRMRELIEELSGRYDDRFIIFDSPPVHVASESIVLAGLVDTVILVVRQGGASKAMIKRLIDTIGKERLLGFVFNDHHTNIVERSLVKGYGGYYHAGYKV